VFVIDEAGMVGSRQMARVLSKLHEAGAKAVLVGDAERLQPIEAGAAFRAIAERTGYQDLTTSAASKRFGSGSPRTISRGAMRPGLPIAIRNTERSGSSPLGIQRRNS